MNENNEYIVFIAPKLHSSKWREDTINTRLRIYEIKIYISFVWIEALFIWKLVHYFQA